jgi:putative peptidoglycan lipid II flippase
MPLAIVNTCFEHGVFTGSDTIATASALAAFAIGLPAFVMNKVFSPGFFAREDTRTPMIFAITSVGVNVCGSLILSYFAGHVGIALATALAAWVNATLLALTLARRGHYAPDDKLRRRLPRIIVASLGMGAVLLSALWFVQPVFEGGHALSLRALTLVALVALGALSYFALAHLLGAMRLGELKAMMTRRGFT